MTDGKEYGIYLTPEERNFFPEGTTYPLFKNGDKIFAYQLGVHECPNITKENGNITCKIYENRPLICRSFPAGYSDETGAIVLLDRCAFTSKHINESWDRESFEGCFDALKEQGVQAINTPQATEMFVLNGKKWMAL
jgi:Fe-S-cluster containining protein